MSKSRTKKAILNTCSAWGFEIVTAVCSFILPRLILSHFGSAYNGITSSISQFIGCISLLQSGIGGVTRAALFRPLAENNVHETSAIVNATAGFMRKIAWIFSGAVLVLATCYPLLVTEDFEWFFTFTLVIILSISAFAQYFFGITYQMVLKADQKNYIISLVSIAATIANTVVASCLILAGCGIHAVKLGSALVYIVPPMFYNIWVRKEYHIDLDVTPNYSALGQRWDAFGHQVANFVNNNTDIMVITFFLGVREVSVYSVYYMIGNAIKKFVMSLGSGISAAFGNMFAKNESQLLETRFTQFELIVYYVATVLLTITAALLTPFVGVYTKGITDVNYCRPVFGYLICLSIYFSCIKIPYEELIYAAGEFRKTRNGAFTEAILNIVISLILVNVIGLNGVVIGTAVAVAYRVFRYHIFICKNLLSRSTIGILLKILYSFVVMISGCCLVNRLLPLSSVRSYLEWILWACVTSLIVILLATVVALVVFRKAFLSTFQFVITVLRRKKK